MNVVAKRPAICCHPQAFYGLPVCQIEKMIRHRWIFNQLEKEVMSRLLQEQQQKTVQGNDRGGGKPLSQGPKSKASDIGVASMEPGVTAYADTDPMVMPGFSVRVLNHLTYGLTQNAVADFNALGASGIARLTAFVDQQLKPDAIVDARVEAILGATDANGDGVYDALYMSLQEQWTKYRLNNNVNVKYGETPATQTQLAALVRAVYTKRQLFEKTAAFWHDHFNVYYKEGGAASSFASYTNDVIRKNAFGNFRALLGAVTKSTAMMFYLDNYTSSKTAPNENFGRELLELHTLGADRYMGNIPQANVPVDPEDASVAKGYVEADVLAAAKALTGWTIAVRPGAAFNYSDNMHDKTEKKIVGRIFAANRGQQDGEDLLDLLAQHPGTARFICTKLIRYFVTDTVPADLPLLGSASKIFRDNWQNPDQIKITLRHILLSADLQSSWQQKIRRPFEIVVAALRAVGSEWEPKWSLPGANNASLEYDLTTRLSLTGHGVYEWTAPNGYPDIQRPWLATNSMAALWRMLSWLPGKSWISGDESTSVLPILKISREQVGVENWRAPVLVNFWCRRLLGYLPKESHRQALIEFLVQNGDRATFVIPDSNAPDASDPRNDKCQDRIRAMVSMILMSPEFMSR